MPGTIDELTSNIGLAALEQVELRSLSWGFVDIAFGEQEAEAAITRALREAGSDANWRDVLDDLVQSAAVRKIFIGDERRYRTRIAELVRLLVRSRQLFPQRPWQTSPTLVSDFRIDIRQRIYPKRDIDREAALARVEEAKPLASLPRAVWRALMEKTPTLSRFQTEASSRLLGSDGENGTIITAGTGSGKTLAFYLPAFVALAPHLETNENYVRAVSIYPRQELLKDQLSEAYRLSAVATSVLAAASKRAFSFGALYYATPRQASAKELEEKGWRKRSGDFICPTLRCPNCEAEMKWRKADLESKIERLVCSANGCNGSTSPATMRLTRDSIRKNPPDFLFTTTEMLNQRLSDAFNRHIFGVGVPDKKKPQYILLDEVHTYSGTSGAQAALVLRRWRHLLSAPVKWVGLSATLKQAEHFFSDLTGLYQDAVSEISPQSSDMEAEGAEYQILLRSDPSSQASTLSTSIQATMLAARLLDSASTPEGRFGRRLFVFTDDLDVTHRLFDDLRDAEAYDRFGRPDTRQPLASLRATGRGDEVAREEFGQRWAMAEALRGSLDNRLVIGRTTSRDPGVDGTADVIVATAALEVGFNDPEVGAVLQHKAPRSIASYLQRRGRAGRRRSIRPTTITVLSDYGRDRIAFQTYEYLFEPVIEREILPTRNAYVLRIQAVFATFDWITTRLAQSGVRGWAWGSLSGPSSQIFDDREYRKGVMSLLRSLIELDDSTLKNFKRFLQGALALDDISVNALLWESPRSLLLEVIPTLVRRLHRDWRLAGGSGSDLNVPFHPLPDFIPRNLFQELSLPEVTIIVPPATTRDVEHEETLSVFQSLSHFAPGRVRRRFADEYGGLAHWVPVDPDATSVEIPLSSYAERAEFVGAFEASVDGTKRSVDVYRPWRIRVSKVQPNTVLHSSNSKWSWLSSFQKTNDGHVISVPEHHSWAPTIPKLEFLLHRFSSALSITRYAIQGEAEIRTRQKRSVVRYRIEGENDEPVGLGFTFEADALLIRPNLPKPAELATQVMPDDVIRWLRYRRFYEAVRTDGQLPPEINSFHREWLSQIFLLSVLAKAESSDQSLSSVIQSFKRNEETAALTPAISAIIAGVVVEEGQDSGTQLESTLRDLLDKRGVIRRLGELAETSFSTGTDEWGQWLHSLLLATLAEASLQACLIAAPTNTAVDGLNLDVFELAGETVIAIAETTVGGGGTIEALGHSFSLEPQAFFRALEAALTPSDLELAGEGLQRIYSWIRSDSTIESLVADLRLAPNHEERSSAKTALVKSLVSKGLPVGQTLSIAMATRVLQSGASAETDSLIKDLLDRWDTLEAKYQVALPVRIAAALMASDPVFNDRLVMIGGQENEIGTVNLLLWPRAGELRQRALQSYNPYVESRPADTAALRSLLSEKLVPVIDMAKPDWRDKLNSALAKAGICRLTIDRDSRQDLRAAAIDLVGSPIDVGNYHFYPTVEAYRLLPNGKLGLDLSLRERI